MASTAKSPPAAPLPASALRGADRFEQALSLGAVVILIAMVAAVARGQGDWPKIPLSVWLHLATIGVALVLTPVMLLRPRGTRGHRQIGYVWVAAMIATAVISLNIRLVNNGGFSMIHILAVWTLIQVPLIIIRARQHDHRRHRSAVRGMVLGALLIAGFFTFPFGRLLGMWLFG